MCGTLGQRSWLSRVQGDTRARVSVEGGLGRCRLSRSVERTMTSIGTRWRRGVMNLSVWGRGGGQVGEGQVRINLKVATNTLSVTGQNWTLEDLHVILSPPVLRAATNRRVLPCRSSLIIFVVQLCFPPSSSTPPCPYIQLHIMNPE